MSNIFDIVQSSTLTITTKESPDNTPQPTKVDNVDNTQRDSELTNHQLTITEVELESVSEDFDELNSIPIIDAAILMPEEDDGIDYDNQPWSIDSDVAELDSYNINIPTKRSTKRSGDNIVIRLAKWIRRKYNKIKLLIKKYRVWKYKIGKVEYTPAIRNTLREHKRTIHFLEKQLDSIANFIEDQESKVQAIETVANEITSTIDVLTNDVEVVKNKTRMMR
jgi:hypothetical protein